MGKISNIMNHYFSDNQRFADLFNGVFFQGRAVIQAENLTEVSQVYHEVMLEKAHSNTPENRAERIRDVSKQLKSGGTLRILALENQELVDYAMPLRCMQYDVMEYSKQLNMLRKQNQEEGKLQSNSERVCKLRKSDRITPVYTLCLYHGIEKWDGPRCLRDMMRFENGQEHFLRVFNDYPFHLYCLNEADNSELFHTEIGILFQALRYRGDRGALKRLILSNSEYRKVDTDTLEVMAVMLDLPSIFKNREKYMNYNNKDREEYNMCQAIREWAEEERSIGLKLGAEENRGIIVRNMLARGMTDEDIMAIAECDMKFIDTVRNR